MNDFNFTGVRMKKRDYFRLPADMRCRAETLMVLSVVAGKPAFVPVLIVG